MYSVDEDRRPRPADMGERRRQGGVLLMLAGATAIGSTGLAAGGTAGALLGADLAHTSAGAGLPPGLLVFGSAAGALLVSRQTARGRRGRGLMLGYLLGAAGAVLVVVAAVARSLPLLLAGSTVLGAANSAIFMTRYAALDASGEADRGRALGAVFSATAIGAVVSPMLMGPGGAFAEAVGLPRLTGLYLVAVLAFGTSALIFAGLSDPRVPWLGRGATVLARGPGAAAGGLRGGGIEAAGAGRGGDPARAVAAAGGRYRRGAGTGLPGGVAEGTVLRGGDTRGAGRRVGDAGAAGLRGALREPRTRLAFAALAAANFVMVGLMAVAPLHLMTHGHGLELIGTLIALHVAGMFGPSPVSGRLADRFGPAAVVLAGGALMLATCAAGTAVGGHGVLAMSGHLLVLGIGWNCAVVGGSTLLAAGVPETLRPRAEAIGEVVMGIGAAVASPVAGVAAAAGGYRAFSLIGALTAAGVLVFVRRTGRRL